MDGLLLFGIKGLSFSIVDVNNRKIYLVVEYRVSLFVGVRFLVFVLDLCGNILFLLLFN